MNIPLAIILFGANSFTFVAVPTHAQRLESSAFKLTDPYSFVLRGGLSQFYGELNRQDFKAVGAIGVSKKIAGTLSVGMDYSAGQLAGERVDFFNSYFLSEYNSLELLGKFNLSDQFFYDPEDKIRATVYTGLGMMFFSSEAFDLSTGERVRFTNSPESRRNPLFLRWGTPKGSRSIRKTNDSARDSFELPDS
jgi:hypothetical protein